MSDQTHPLIEARTKIDELDQQIQALISDRAKVAQAIAHIKQDAGDVGDFYRPSREAEVLRKVMARNEGPLTNETVARLMREIMSACLSLESPLTVAYLGPEGTYTQAAVSKHFGNAVRSRPMAAIDEIFRDVEAGNSDYGVVPIENSSEGVVSHTLDLFTASPLRICGEVTLAIHHHLLSDQDSTEGVTKVLAHPQSLAQCRNWLQNRLPAAEQVPTPSNADAARRVAAHPCEGWAAIAGKAAAELYELNIAAANIEDHADNTTRFLIIGRQNTPPTDNDMTSFVCSAKSGSDRPGALYELLKPFSDAGVNMTRIESRPSRRGNWNYNFFIDVVGHADDEPLASTFKQVAKNADFFKVLGSYPRAPIV